MVAEVWEEASAEWQPTYCVMNIGSLLHGPMAMSSIRLYVVVFISGYCEVLLLCSRLTAYDSDIPKLTS